MKYQPPIGAAENAPYIDANPTQGVEGSPVPAGAIEHPMREIVNVIEEAGLTPDEKELDQMVMAIKIIAAKLIPPVAESVGYLLQAGMMIDASGDKLDKNCVWPDGSLVIFDDWPDLEARFAAGYIKALPKGTAAAIIADNPGLWMQHDSGLYLPNVGGLFPRPWTPAQTNDAGRAAGSKQEDTIREMKGRVGHFIYGATQYNSGVLKVVNSATKYLNTMESTSGSVNSKYIDFDASLVVDTSDENRPINYAQPVQIYLGRYKTEVQ